MTLEAERACDDAVLGREDRADYAEQLLRLAGRMSAPPPIGLAMAGPGSDLSARVYAILSPVQARGRAGASVVGMALTTMIGVGIGVAALRPVTRPVDTAAAPDLAISTELDLSPQDDVSIDIGASTELDVSRE